MSGGVDSSVSAALLKQQGYRVVGVYMQNWTQTVAGVECPWKQDLADAKTVALRLRDHDVLVKLRERSGVLVGEVSGFRPGTAPAEPAGCE